MVSGEVAGPVTLLTLFLRLFALLDDRDDEEPAEDGVGVLVRVDSAEGDAERYGTSMRSNGSVGVGVRP